VVLADSVPRFPVLNDMTRAALVAAGVEPDAVLMSIDEFMAGIGTDPERLWNLITTWRADTRYAETSFSNFLIFEKHELPRELRPPLAQALLEGLRRDSQVQLFNRNTPPLIP
jgi:hypothetical protein